MHKTMTTAVKWICTLAVLLLMAASSEASFCTMYCSRVYCANLSEGNCDGIVVTGGGYCGCCDACFRTLSRGEACGRSNPGSSTTSICQPGTSCTNSICL